MRMYFLQLILNPVFMQAFKIHSAIVEDYKNYLNSFFLSWTPYPQLKWGDTQEELEERHILFMTDDRDGYIDKLFDKLMEMVK